MRSVFPEKFKSYNHISVRLKEQIHIVIISFAASGYHSSESSTSLFFIIRLSLQRTVFIKIPTSWATFETAFPESLFSK